MKKIYVDKLPKTCFECLCGDEYLGCNLGCTFKTCKLKSIKEYEQQIRADERKKVCQMINEMQERTIKDEEKSLSKLRDGFYRNN